MPFQAGVKKMQVICPGDPVPFGGPTAVVLGSFDGLHRGHQAVIGAALETGMKTVVVTFWQHPGEVLGTRHVRELMSRAYKEEIMRRFGVDALAFLDFRDVRELSPEEFVKRIVIGRFHAKKVFCGFNYRFGKDAAAGQRELSALLKKYGAEGICIEPVCEDGEPVSSTRIRRLIDEGDVRTAARLLGRPYSISFEVVTGRQLGRKLGTPTINQLFPASHIVPRYGVYATLTHVGGGWKPSVTNVGIKPTVGSSEVSAETYILGFQGDLYGKTVEVGFLEYLRPEVRFESLEELKLQIRRDAVSAVEVARAHGERAETASVETAVRKGYCF